ASGAGFEQCPSGGARGTAGAKQKDAYTCHASDQLGSRDVDTFHVRVVAVDDAVFRPEGVACARAYDGFTGSIDRGARPRLVRHGDVAAAACVREGAHERRDVLLDAAQGDVDSVEPLLRE